MPKTLIGVYWSPRADDISVCTRRSVEHFRLICELGEGLEGWFSKAYRKPKPLSEIEVSSKIEIESLLASGVNRRDIDRSVIVELGWSLSAWNGDLKGVSASTNLLCGSTSDRVENCAIVEISRDDGDGLDPLTATDLLNSLAELWCADSGVVSNSVWHPNEQRREIAEIATYERPQSR